MIVSTCYDKEKVPSVAPLYSPARCHFCGYDSKPMKKGTKALKMAYNTGPTGRAFVCMKHARKLRDELAELDLA